MNYQPNDYESFPSAQTALIAYNIAGSSSTPTFLNVLSNSFSSKRVITSGPFSVFNSNGNYGKKARSIFDVSYTGPVDQCLNWYNSRETKTIMSNLLDSLTKAK